MKMMKDHQSLLIRGKAWRRRTMFRVTRIEGNLPIAMVTNILTMQRRGVGLKDNESGYTANEYIR